MSNDNSAIVPSRQRRLFAADSVMVKRGQRGVALVLSLIILAAMLMGGIAMMRSIDAGIMIAGNLAMRQGTVAAGDRALEVASRFVVGSVPTALGDNDTANGYYATHQALTRNQLSDEATYTARSAPTIVDATRGLTTHYLIHRMCANPGPPDANCASYQPPGTADEACRDTNCLGLRPQTMLLYRVTAYVVGPRNSRGIVQTFVTAPMP